VLFDIIGRVTPIHIRTINFVISSSFPSDLFAQPRDRPLRNKLFARARVAYPLLPRNE